MVPLDEGDRVLAQQGVEALEDVGVRLGVARGRAPPGWRAVTSGPATGCEDPVRVRSVEVGVGVDHLRLDPQPEHHARGRRRSDVSGCSPSGHSSSSTYQSPRPAVSSRRCLNHPSSRTKSSTPRSAASSTSSLQAPEVLVEVDRLPGVEQQPARSVRSGMVRPGTQLGVEDPADAVDACQRCRPRDPGRRVRPSGLEPELTRLELLATEEDRAVLRRPVDRPARGCRSTRRASPRPPRGGSRSRPAPTRTPIDELKPGRPRRVDRVHVPTSTGCRCGCRSRQW